MLPDEQTEPSGARALIRPAGHKRTISKLDPTKSKPGAPKSKAGRREIQAKRNKIQIRNRLLSCEKIGVFQSVMTSSSLDAYVSSRRLQMRGSRSGDWV